MLVVNALAGCLTGDTVINVNRGKKGFSISLETLAHQFHQKDYWITRSNGIRSRIRKWEPNILTYVARADNGSIKLGCLKDVWCSGIKVVFRITTNTGRTIKASSEHPFMLADGSWLMLKRLRIGMSLSVDGGQVGNVKKPKTQYKYMVTKYHPLQINNGNGTKVAVHRLVVEASMNNISLDKYVSILRTNPNRAKLLQYLTQEQIVHHKDEDSFNNDLDNLEVISNQKDHSDKHNWVTNVLSKVGFEEIVSIEKVGEEITYDIEMENDPHNFLANGFVVHNTGKTTTAMFGLGCPVPKGMVLSKEQIAIVKQMRSYTWEKAAAMAFNSSIADELKKRVPPGVEAATSNAFGYRAWLKHIDKKRVKVDAWKNRNILTDIAQENGIDDDMVKQWAPDIDKLVSLCKGNLLTPDDATLSELCDKFDIDPPNVSKTFELVREVYELGIKEFEYFDFDDQLFMPLYHNISIPQFDLVMVDEAQDLNPAKQQLAFKMVKPKGNLVIIGDRHQAIYGFTGADSSSMDNMAAMMRKISVAGDGKRLNRFNELPLTVTRRCPKKVVEVANKYVPELRAHDEALEGEVRYIKQSGFVDELVADPIGRMILCRVNAPLTGLAFKLLRANRRCFIQGKDIGVGIKKILTKTKERLLVDAIPKGLEKINARIVKLQTSSKPDASKIESLEDQILCIEYLTQDITTVDEFCDRVDMLFKDTGSPMDHQLSSVHKSKGLEKKHVCIYIPSKLPMLVKAKKGGKRMTPGGSVVPGFQVQQEYNLAYVAYTRAQEILTFVVEDEQERNYDYKRDNDD